MLVHRSKIRRDELKLLYLLTAGSICELEAHFDTQWVSVNNSAKQWVSFILSSSLSEYKWNYHIDETEQIFVKIMTSGRTFETIIKLVP